MATIFEEIRTLKEEGKLHAALIKRTRILFVISFIMALVLVYNALFRDFTGYFLLIGGLLVCIGLFFGLFVFSKMNAVSWNEEQEVVQSDKMDTFGYGILALYIVFEISLRTFLKTHFTVNIVPLLLSGIFGTLLGRAMGTLFRIHKVYVSRDSP